MSHCGQNWNKNTFYGALVLVTCNQLNIEPILIFGDNKMPRQITTQTGIKST